MNPEDTTAAALTISPTVISAVLADVTTELAAIVGEQYLLGLEVTMSTSFNDDLALESVHFVALASALQQRYGEQVDFVEFLSGLELEELINLTVGELVAYIAGSLEVTSGPLDAAGERG